MSESSELRSENDRQKSAFFADSVYAEVFNGWNQSDSLKEKPNFAQGKEVNVVSLANSGRHLEDETKSAMAALVNRKPVGFDRDRVILPSCLSSDLSCAKPLPPAKPAPKAGEEADSGRGKPLPAWSPAPPAGDDGKYGLGKPFPPAKPAPRAGEEADSGRGKPLPSWSPAPLAGDDGKYGLGKPFPPAKPAPRVGEEADSGRGKPLPAWRPAPFAGDEAKYGLGKPLSPSKPYPGAESSKPSDSRFEKSDLMKYAEKSSAKMSAGYRSSEDFTRALAGALETIRKTPGKSASDAIEALSNAQRFALLEHIRHKLHGEKSFRDAGKGAPADAETRGGMRTEGRYAPSGVRRDTSSGVGRDTASGETPPGVRREVSASRGSYHIRLCAQAFERIRVNPSSEPFSGLSKEQLQALEKALVSRLIR